MAVSCVYNYLIHFLFVF